MSASNQGRAPNPGDRDPLYCSLLSLLRLQILLVRSFWHKHIGISSLLVRLVFWNRHKKAMNRALFHSSPRNTSPLSFNTSTLCRTPNASSILIIFAITWWEYFDLYCLSFSIFVRFFHSCQHISEFRSWLTIGIVIKISNNSNQRVFFLIEWHPITNSWRFWIVAECEWKRFISQ